MARSPLPMFVVLLTLAGCTLHGGEDGAPTPVSCNMSQLAMTRASAGAHDPHATQLARVWTYSAMIETGPIDWLVVWSDGHAEARTDTGGQALGTLETRRVALDTRGVLQLERCIDETGFVTLQEGSHTPAVGRSGDKFCAVSDASTTTVVARASSGVVRTASVDGLHTPIAGCEMDRPRELMLLYDALDQLRASIAAV